MFVEGIIPLTHLLWLISLPHNVDCHLTSQVNAISTRLFATATINWQLVDNLLVLLLPSFFKLLKAVDKITIQINKIHGVVRSMNDLL